MKPFKHIIYVALVMLATLPLTSCIDDLTPGSSFLTKEQVQKSEDTQQTMLRGIAYYMTSCLYHGQYNCAGYPGQMYLNECYCEDFPVHKDAYNYYLYDETGLSVTYRGYYLMMFYYTLIGNCNQAIESVDVATANANSLQTLGMALGFRALAYMDLARYLEFQPTGYTELDDAAKSMEWPAGVNYDENVVQGCLKLTASIVTPGMTTEQLKHNPRAPFYTMYRFILKDLKDAERYLDGCTPSSVFPGEHAIAGLQARLWLEMATRFELMPEDLTAQLAHENDADGYAPLGITSAADCYQKAAEYAEKAMKGYAPMTQEQYQNPTTGFNTAADNSWIWIMRNASKDEFESLYYYYSFLGQMVSEPSWGLAQYGGLFRCITNRLYKKMHKNDWRRFCWVSEEAAGKKTAPAGYQTNLTGSEWRTLPAYANLKFRSRSLTDSYEGRVADYPLMRMEEMIFIHAEATAKLGNLTYAAQEISDFVTDHRLTKGKYSYAPSDIDEFMETMLEQKRIEFWGEGIMYWDYKRLKKSINRKGTNYLSTYSLSTNDGYVVPWMNICIPSGYGELLSNTAAMGTPDPSDIVK